MASNSDSTGKIKPIRHVYKTGAAGCGGKAAPTSAKNSGTPLPCPFCDRIFKQDGRLKEHLKNKHVDDNQDGLENGDRNTIVSDSPGVEGGNISGQIEAQKSSYPIKTPKTLLHEWCQKNKRPGPKFKHVEVDRGFHCRVILPDTKKNEDDIILWYQDTPTHSAQEAQHRAAVVGLHHVLGNRRIDRILGEEYRPQWRNLNVAAEKLKEHLKENPPQLRVKPLPLPKELHSVFMSENNRRLVEDLLQLHESSNGKSSDGSQNQCNQANNGNSLQSLGDFVGVTGDWSTVGVSWPVTGKEKDTSSTLYEQQTGMEENWEKEEVQDQGLVDFSRESRTATGIQAARRKLLGLGFTTYHVNWALSERPELSGALDWLILNVPERELPSKFAPDASKASVQVLVGGKRSPYDVFTGLNEDSLSHLQEYGYALGDCATALSNASGDEDVALCYLFHSAFGGSFGDPGAFHISGNAVELAEIRAEERLALQTIFGHEVLLVSQSHAVFELFIPDSVGASLKMEVRISPQSVYPFEVPIIAFQSKKLSPEFLLNLTEHMVEKASLLLGSPMIYELVHLAKEWAQELFVKFGGYTAKSKSESVVLHNLKPTEPCDDKTGESQENLSVSNLSTSSRSFDGGDDLPVMQAYVPPALRKNSSGTAVQLKEGRGVGIADTNWQSQDTCKIKAKTLGIDVNKENAKLKTEWENLQKSGRHRDMWSFRSQLPAFQQRSTLLNAITTHQVTIIAGQTGCGKSTQVPQFVLEDYIESDKGALCNIVCTQPRRLSAIALADRVSKERGQIVGETIGYTVRLESCRSRHTRVVFCTTGILLRRLLSDPDLQGVTHVIIDEVHERSQESDLLLLLLRELLKRVSTGLHLILMSATVDATLFLHYFRQEVQLDPCVVSIPGFTFPVHELYLEDALDLTGYRVGRNSRYALRKKVSSIDIPTLLGSRGGICGPSQDMDNWESLAEERGEVDIIAVDERSEATRQSLSIVDQSLINYDLIELLICAILQDALPLKVSEPLLGNMEKLKVKIPEEIKQAGAVLVFLPGIAEIRRLQRQLQSSSQIAASHSGSLWVLALHGSLSSDEQRRVFLRPSPDGRKVVLATNIAETSVTIDDVVYVIDTGRLREVRYDHSRGISCLEETWVSKASARQRCGRAGRVRSGCCIRLFSREQFQRFNDHQLPEILRVSLDGLCLKVKSFFVEGFEGSVSKIITPPELEAVQISVRNLQSLNALDGDERLTPLGHHLSRMPVDARVGKMLLFGCMLKCLNPVLTVAAALSGRTPFLSPVDKREEANAARLRFAGTSKSDHLTIVVAYNGWLSARLEGRNAESNYCTMNFLSREVLIGIEASRQDFVKILTEIGFLPVSKGIDQNKAVSALNLNASSIRVVKAVICAGFYPNIVRVLHPEKTYVQTEGGTVAKVAAAREVRFFTKADGRVFLHPSSVNFSIGKFERPWLVFTEKMKTSKVFLRDSTMVPAYGLLLFGGKVKVDHERQSISIDGWLEFEAPARIAVLIKELRAKVDSLLFEKIESPSLDISSSPVVSALICLLTTDGF